MTNNARRSVTMSAPLSKPYTWLPDYADVDYVDGKLSVARGIIARATDPDLRRRWQETVDILLDQRSALAAALVDGSPDHGGNDDH